MTNRKRRAYFAIGMCVVAIGAIIALTVVLSNNIQYFRTVSEAVAHRSDRSQFRIAGAVVNGSVVPTHAGVDFKITDGKATAEIVHHGDPPQLCKSGAPVVCEGRWGPNGAFASDRILIKHGSDYQPPTVKQPSAARSQ